MYKITTAYDKQAYDMINTTSAAMKHGSRLNQSFFEHAEFLLLLDANKLMNESIES